MLKTLHFSEIHIRVFAHALKRDGERVLARTVTDWNPWWALGLVKRTYCVLVTDRRAIIFEHGFNFFAGFVIKAVHSLPWSGVSEARTKGWFFKKKLVLRGQGEQVSLDGEMLSGGGPFDRTMVIDRGFFGLFSPVSATYPNARMLVETWNAARGMGAAVGYESAQTPAQYAPQLAAPQYAPQLAAPQPVPQVNAPAYVSAPPPPPQFNAPAYVSAPPPPPQFNAPAYVSAAPPPPQFNAPPYASAPPAPHYPQHAAAGPQYPSAPPPPPPHYPTQGQPGAPWPARGN